MTVIEEHLPFAPSCENNKQAIAEVFQRHLTSINTLLEIGGGTAQHACFFASRFPSVYWQSTEMKENVSTLNKRIAHAALANLPEGIALNVNDAIWLPDDHSAFHQGKTNSIFTANTLHIMSYACVERFFQGVGNTLAVNGLLMIYGPFKYDGEFTSESNGGFDLWLKQRNPVSGVRDFEAVNKMAQQAGCTVLEDNDMPANNQMLIWKKIA